MEWRLGILGFPVEHSLTPQLQEEGLRLMGLKGTSRRVAVPKEEAGSVGELLANEFDAVSVTMPLKPIMAQFCTKVSDVARRTESINSVLRTPDGFHGDSTDGGGLSSALEGEFDLSLAGFHVVVLGSGGAARAIIDSFVDKGVDSVAVLARTQSAVDVLTSAYDNVIDYTPTYRPIDLIVNTTPATGRADEGGVLNGVTSTTVAVDITYSPPVSPWLQMHADQGCRIQNGLPMLAYQAALQMNWWWNADLRGGDLLKVIQ